MYVLRTHNHFLLNFGNLWLVWWIVFVQGLVLRTWNFLMKMPTWRKHSSFRASGHYREFTQLCCWAWSLLGSFIIQSCEKSVAIFSDQSWAFEEQLGRVTFRRQTEIEIAKGLGDFYPCQLHTSSWRSYETAVSAETKDVLRAFDA